MTELATTTPEFGTPAPAGDKRSVPPLSRPEKAAIVLGVLGEEGAAPLIEQFDEETLASFASAMARLERVAPEAVAATVAEFLSEIEAQELSVAGGLPRARSMLQQHVTEGALARILDDAEMPSVHNVWQKLAKIDDIALSEFLSGEHPQTAAVVLSKMPPEHSARVLGLVDKDRACEIIVGLTRITQLDSSVIEAIGRSVSRDFLAHQRQAGRNFKPAERIGAIMNFAPGDVRQSVMDFLERETPDLADNVKRTMFTFTDIPKRIEKRDITAIVRAVDRETLLKALSGAEQDAPETHAFILGSISSRVAEQVREDLAEFGKVKVREAEDAQTAILKAIKDLQRSGELKMKDRED